MDAQGGAVARSDLAPDAQTPSRYRWYALLILTAVATLNNIDRNVVPAMAAPLKSEFGLTDSQFGFLAGMVYAIAYCVTGIPLGFVIDRVKRTRLLAGLLAVWSGATVLGGLATTYLHLVLARVALASAESGAMPASFSILSDYFPKSQRASAVGLYQLNNAIALALAFSLGGFIALHWGWRAGFFIAGVPGILLSIVVLVTLREPQRGAQDEQPAAPAEASSLIPVLQTIWQKKTLLYLLCASVLIIAGQSGISAFFALFFVQIHELRVDQAGLAVAVILGVGSAIGTPSGGFLADFLSRRSVSGGAYFVALVTALAIPCAIVGLLAPGPQLAIGGLLAYMALMTCFYGATLGTYLSVAPTAMRGALTSVLIVTMNLVGYGFGPLVAGLASDGLAGLGVADPLRWAMVAMTGLFVVSVGFYILTGRNLAAERRD